MSNKNYSVKLMFQFRVVIDNSSNKRRMVEEKIVVFRAQNENDLLIKANKRGKEDEYSYTNDDGNKVYYEFIGILDAMEHGIECEKDEVWFEFKDMLNPSERKKDLLPTKSQLLKQLK